MNKGNRRHHRSVKGLRGESRKVRNLKRQWSSERADRELCRCHMRNGSGCAQCNGE
jgi:hypothetical protein